MTGAGIATERTVAGANFVFFGGTAGIGQAAALEMARRRANVLVVARNVDAGADTVAKLRRAGAGSAEFLRGDLSTIAGMKATAEGVVAWRPSLHGVLHSAMTAFQGRVVTPDGLEFAFALQYMARATLNRLLLDSLVQSGDGRVVHIAGAVGEKQTPDLDDLQFERRKWSFFKSVLGTHALGFLHIQEASRLWEDLPVMLTATAVGPTKTNAMLDPRMPLIMRLMGKFGTSPAASARNAVTALTIRDAGAIAGVLLPKPKAWTPERIAFDPANAMRLWDITTQLAAQHGVTLR